MDTDTLKVDVEEGAVGSCHLAVSEHPSHAVGGCARVRRFGSALYEIVPGFIVATLGIIVVSRLDREPPQEILAMHQQVRQSLRETGY